MAVPAKRDKNREVLGWIGAGLAVVIGGLWTVFVYFSPRNKSSTGGSTIQASCGSAAIGASVSGATITAGNIGNCPEQKPEQKR